MKGGRGENHIFYIYVHGWKEHDVQEEDGVNWTFLIFLQKICRSFENWGDNRFVFGGDASADLLRMVNHADPS
jgi:hypothetical protein